MNNCPAGSFWPADYIAAGISYLHCDDVLVGCYDVPFNPEKPPIILDLGANIGAFARWAATRWPGCTIHCYEPAPENFALLERTIAAIPVERATIDAKQLAVFDQETPMVLHLASTNCGAHSFYNLGEQGDKTATVQAIHAQSLPRGDILKLDVEGAEMAILLALHYVGRLREFSAVMLEYHSDMIGLAVKQLLAANGFTLTGEKLHEKNRGELRFVKSSLLAVPSQMVTALPGVDRGGKKVRLYIATPAHDHRFHVQYAYSLIKLARTGRYSLTLNKVGGCGVARARDNMAHEFLTTTDAEVCACIDSDIGFEPEHVDRALALNQPIVCMPYALKQAQLQWCMNEIPGEVPDPATGFQKVSTAGTGFMLIRRPVFEKMIEAFPDIAFEDDMPAYRGQTRWDFFSMGVLKRRYLTEDWYICVRARMLGFDIWMDALNHVEHYDGGTAYPMQRQKAGMYLSAPGAMVEPESVELVDALA